MDKYSNKLECGNYCNNNSNCYGLDYDEFNKNCCYNSYTHDECYKYQHMANYKRNQAKQLQYQAQKLINEAYILDEKAKNHFNHCNNEYNNKFSSYLCQSNYECECSCMAKYKPYKSI